MVMCKMGTSFGPGFGRPLRTTQRRVRRHGGGSDADPQGKPATDARKAGRRGRSNHNRKQVDPAMVTVQVDS